MLKAIILLRALVIIASQMIDGRKDITSKWSEDIDNLEISHVMAKNEWYKSCFTLIDFLYHISYS